MNLTVDIGNTRVKWTLFDGESLVDEGVGLPFPPADHVIYCATGEIASDVRHALPENAFHFHSALFARQRLPIKIGYATPATLGADRVAAACGAWKVTEGAPCVVVDAGTCITVDYVDSTGSYLGGAILPGISMKFHALHTFTAKLPLLDNVASDNCPVTGRTTEESMVAGVLTATRFAVDGFVNYYRRKDARVRVLLTGGDAGMLADAGMLRDGQCTVQPHLVALGLNEVLKMVNSD